MSNRVSPTEPLDIDDDDADREQVVSIDEVHALLHEQRLAINTHEPATVISYEPATQRATVQLDRLLVIVCRNGVPPVGAVQLYGTPGSPNLRAAVLPPPLMDVPVDWGGTANGYMTFPLMPGDQGSLHVPSRSLDAWLERGVPVDPTKAIAHDIADAFFVPGLRSSTKKITPPTDQTAAVWEYPQLKAGRNAVFKAAVAKLVHDYLKAMVSGSAASFFDGGTALTAYLNANPYASMEATKLLVE